MKTTFFYFGCLTAFTLLLSIATAAVWSLPFEAAMQIFADLMKIPMIFLASSLTLDLTFYLVTKYQERQ